MFMDDSSVLESELIVNIQEYKSQLEEINAALLNITDEGEKTKLQEIQNDLVSLLELSLNQLEQQSVSEDVSGQCIVKERPKACNVDKEFERFMAEISEIENNEGVEFIEESNASHKVNENLPEKSTICTDENLKSLEEDLKCLEGENVRAPFKEKWGGYSYHNGIVLSLIKDSDDKIGVDPKVMVLYSQPTCVEMKPCQFFLSGHCKFTDDKCRYSHGVPISVNDLKDYEEPDRNELVSGSEVLALHGEKSLWHRGKIEDVLEGRKGFSFNCYTCKSVVEVDISAMVPVFSHEDVPPDPNEKNGVNNSVIEIKDERIPVSKEEETEVNFVPHSAWLTNSMSTKLGAWEQYTKGIGSKLMAQMGYVIGTGLGPRGEGRLDPVDTLVYPQGISLDHCKKLREASGGECLLSVEKRLLKQQKKEEQVRKKQADDLNAKTSVFDIINKKLGNEEDPTDEDSSSSTNKLKLEVSKESLVKASTKELNKTNFQLYSQIDKLKTELKGLKKSLNRHSGDPVVSQFIKKQMGDKMGEIKVLQEAERSVEYERRERINKKKYCKF